MLRDDDFEKLFAEHAEGLFAFLVYRTGDRHLSEDLMAEAFARALRARRGFDARRAGPKTWLYAIALNCLRDHARRQAAEGRALERAEGAGAAEATDILDLVGERDRLAHALATLAPEEREVVALRFGADLTVPDIARVLKTRLTTVEGRVYRALRKLREQLAEPAQDAADDTV